MNRTGCRYHICLNPNGTLEEQLSGNVQNAIIGHACRVVYGNMTLAWPNMRCVQL